MLRTRVIPCLLLKDEGLVKTVKFKKPSYIGDAINTIRIFNELEVDELILLDITATLERKKPNFSLIEQIASECFMPLAYGGGITNIDDMKKILKIGVEKIAINSYALRHPEIIQAAADVFGSQAVIVSIDAKKNSWGKYAVYSHVKKKNLKLHPIEWAKEAVRLGAGEILITSVDRDGTWEGYDQELITKTALAVDVPVIACGGAGKVEHFTQAVKIGKVSAVAAGSMVVYQGKDLGVLVNFPSREELEQALL